MSSQVEDIRGYVALDSITQSGDVALDNITVKTSVLYAAGTFTHINFVR